MRRARLVLGSVFVVLGVFWAGRESSHGLTAFWEHWWCPIPFVLVVLGVVGVIAARPMQRPV
jgi:hypothetical protein